MKPAVLGTRASPLALAQTRGVMADLKKAWPGRNFEIRTIKTTGDKLTESPDLVGKKLDKGLFTGELEQALLRKEIDIAVHSLKDLPTEATDGLALGAILKRADARDVLITRGPTSLAALDYYSVLATGSPRRTAQITLARADLRVEPVRGNIDTRLKKFRENPEWTGIILAAAGLARLKPDVKDLVVTPLSFDVMLPAPGQGALAVQIRQDDQDLRSLLKVMHDPDTFVAVSAERMFLLALGGGCEEPIGAYAEITPDGLLKLDGIAWLPGEVEARRAHLVRRVDQAEKLGVDLAMEISL